LAQGCLGEPILAGVVDDGIDGAIGAAIGAGAIMPGAAPIGLAARWRMR
jgi:thiazole synthase ThiGH ThiG subunit